MKHSVTTLMAFIVAAILFSQCTGGKQPAETPQVTTDSDSVSTVPDSTVYGVALESGMSAIYMRTNNGDTLEIDKDDEKGYGDIYGYVEEGDSFAVTKRQGADGLVVVKAYNLSLLRKFNVKTEIRNGLLVVAGNDTVGVKNIDDDSLVVTSMKTGTTRTFYPKKK